MNFLGWLCGKLDVWLDDIKSSKNHGELTTKRHIIVCSLRASGMTFPEIAKALRMSESYCCRVTKETASENKMKGYELWEEYQIKRG